jgi:hypothetical protein
MNAPFPNPLMPRPADRNDARNLPKFHPNLPQFPAGTQVALAREMLVVDHRGEIRPTRLIESVQFRFYREVPNGGVTHPEALGRLERTQDAYEFRFTRKHLFSGNAGGLYALAPDAKDFMALNPPSYDVFESESDSPPKPNPVMRCSACHGGQGTNIGRGPGIYSVLAYRRDFSTDPPTPAFLQEQERSQQEAAAISWKRNHPSWELLQGLMTREQSNGLSRPRRCTLRRDCMRVPVACP